MSDQADKCLKTHLFAVEHLHEYKPTKPSVHRNRTYRALKRRAQKALRRYFKARLNQELRDAT